MTRICPRGVHREEKRKLLECNQPKMVLLEASKCHYVGPVSTTTWAQFVQHGPSLCNTAPDGLKCNPLVTD